MSETIIQGFDGQRGRYSDAWSKSVLWTLGVDEVLLETSSDFQELLVMQTQEFGRLLVLDGNLQCAERDEAAYHELLVHPALCRKGAAAEGLRVLIIGGGDGGSAREALRHDDVSSVELVDIDAKVMEVSRKYLPSIWRMAQCKKGEHRPLDDDDRLHIYAEDGVAFLEKKANAPCLEAEKYDLVVVDASDPVGPGTVLYSDRFYAAIEKVLKKTGAVSVQSGSWFYFPEILQTVFHGLKAHFPVVMAYECFSAVYPGGIWNLCLATRGDDPQEVRENRASQLQEVGEGCDWYDAKAHVAAFSLPRNARRVLEKKPPSLEALEKSILALS